MCMYTYIRHHLDHYSQRTKFIDLRQLEAPLSIDTPRYLSLPLCPVSVAVSQRLAPVCPFISWQIITSKHQTKPNRKQNASDEGTVSLCHGNHGETRHGTTGDRRQENERKSRTEKKEREKQKEREREREREEKKETSSTTHTRTADSGGHSWWERRRARYAVCRPLETPAAVSRARLAFVVEGTRRYHRVTRTNRRASNEQYARASLSRAEFSSWRIGADPGPSFFVPRRTERPSSSRTNSLDGRDDTEAPACLLPPPPTVPFPLSPLPATHPHSLAPRSLLLRLIMPDSSPTSPLPPLSTFHSTLSCPLHPGVSAVLRVFCFKTFRLLFSLSSYPRPFRATLLRHCPCPSQP